MRGKRFTAMSDLIGWYKVKLTRGGPFVPARVFRACCCTVEGGGESVEHEWTETCDRFPPPTCHVDGVEREGYMERIRLYGKTIDEAEHDYMVADAAWARDHSPDDPKAKPAEKIDLNKTPSLF